MLTVSLVQAQALLSELLDEVENGEKIVITRHGKEIAHLSPAAGPKRPLPLRELAEFRATMPC
ncbi:MAG: type II toxin-antitoxin system prevent-host-death family antitoxin [Gammaproteobacteria bacterium]|nr:type II toxin-antitoxin system prevent-host-death family antitoxin [Gammaproteobacteria bacterium]